MCVQVEDPFQQRQLLQDDSEAVNISFLSSTRGGAVGPQQLRGRPQLFYNKSGTSHHPNVLLSKYM